MKGIENKNFVLGWSGHFPILLAKKSRFKSVCKNPFFGSGGSKNVPITLNQTFYFQYLSSQTTFYYVIFNVCFFKNGLYLVILTKNVQKEREGVVKSENAIK